MLHRFETVKGTLRLWQQRGESYEHVLMKAIGYAMHVEEYPSLEVERSVGLRYKPDLIAVAPGGEFDFWGECGLITVRKTVWLAKHSGAKRLVLFKIGHGADQLTGELRGLIEPKYREGRRLRIVNFVREIRDLTASKQIAKVSTDWYTETII
jgi:hypothetical protein